MDARIHAHDTDKYPCVVAVLRGRNRAAAGCGGQGMGGARLHWMLWEGLARLHRGLLTAVAWAACVGVLRAAVAAQNGGTTARRWGGALAGAACVA